MTRSKGRHLSYSWLLLGGILFCQFFLASPAAQGQYGNNQQGLRANDVQMGYCDFRSLEFTVFSDAKAKARLDRQSVARLYDKGRKLENWKTSTEDSVLSFCVDVGDYDLDISAVGYLTEHREVRVDATLYNIKVQIVLQKDPTAVDLNASDSDLPPNTRRDVKSAASALKNSNFKEAQKRLERAYRVAPSSSQINFLLGYLCLMQKDFEKSESYLTRAALVDPRGVQTLTMLGRVQLQREHYGDARKTLEQAVEANSGYWVAHNLLADAYLHLKEYDKARQQAQFALDEGKGAASVAQLILGQALADLGQTQEGLQTLKRFLETNPNNPAVPQVKDLIAEIEKRASGQGAAGEVRTATDLALAASVPSLPPSAWGPPGVDDVKPLANVDVPCPYNQVIDMSGQRVKELVDSITQFAATEEMVHEQLDPVGKPITKETRKFNYVASITEATPGLLAVDEYRDLRYGISDLPDRIVTSGFMSLALIFHPDMRENFQITCEGLGEWHGQATWLMYFRQRKDKPNRFAEFTVGSDSYPINMKGRAWITADTFQIVRIESELMDRVPLLAVQHQIAEYGPVHFQRKNIDLWLPQSVDLYFELNRRRYYRRHSFDHFMLFAIDSQEKPGTIKDAPQSSPGQPPAPGSTDASKAPSGDL